ncbi:MAG: deoxyribonuclease IV [Chloroflexi bacterium]|nr:deoxyribonuclease IV [Chloroflexota bacterium]
MGPAMKIGAHVSTAGGLDKAVDRAQEIGAEAMQIFGSPPQSWQLKTHPTETVQAFLAKVAATGIGPTFLHGVYLVNLATENADNLRKGIESLVFYLDLAAQIRSPGVIFHVGSHKGAGLDQVLPRVRDAFREALERTPAEAWLIIENNAGQGQQVGRRFEEVARVMEAVGRERVRVCLDTAHCFASGYEVSTREGLDATFDEFEREIGLRYLVAVHANDSKPAFNSNVDRHANIGEGHIGLEGFRAMMQHAAFADIPFLLEVPGFENKGPDRKNVEILRSLRDS